MSGSNFLLDTNVIIYHLAGNSIIEGLLEESGVYISGLTYAELLAGNLSNDEQVILTEYLKAVYIVHTNDFICEKAAHLRKETKLKLPDALIAATSLFLDLPLITFDSDFEKINHIRIIKLST